MLLVPHVQSLDMKGQRRADCNRLAYPPLVQTSEVLKQASSFTKIRPTFGLKIEVAYTSIAILTNSNDESGTGPAAYSVCARAC